MNSMKRILIFYFLVITHICCAQSDTIPKIPFEGMDLSWD